jgi:hypothetical protein
MDTNSAYSSSRPAGRNVTPNVVGAPTSNFGDFSSKKSILAEESYSDTQPLCDASEQHPIYSEPIEESRISQHGGPNMNLAMHYLDNMHHATHWLKQHEIERKQIPLAERLRSIKTCECLKILAHVGQTKRESLSLQRSQTAKIMQFQSYVDGSKHVLESKKLEGADDNLQDLVVEQDLGGATDMKIDSSSNVVGEQNVVREQQNVEEGVTLDMAHMIRDQERQILFDIQLQEFWDQINDVSHFISIDDCDLPDGYIVPVCHCGVECRLMRYPDRDLYYTMWACSSQSCMVWGLYNCIDNDGHVVRATRTNSFGFVEEVATADAMASGQQIEAHNIERHGSWDARGANSISWSINTDDFFDLSPTDAVDSSASAKPQAVNTVFGRLTLEKFWEYVNRSQRTLDENTALFIQNQLTDEAQKVCSCNLVCELVWCIASGGIYAICPQKACFSVFIILERTALLQLDIGQLTAFGDSQLDRYTTLTHCMRWFGHSFTEKFILDLHGRPPDAPFPHGSYAICKHLDDLGIVHENEAGSTDKSVAKHVETDVADGKQDQLNEEHCNSEQRSGDEQETVENTEDEEIRGYDCFISYRGATGSIWLWLSLCGQMNLFPALFFLVGICPFCVLALHFVKEPCVNMPSVFVSCYPSDNALSSHYLIFSVWCSAIICFIVIFWNPLFSWVNIPYLAPQKKIFLDKFCCRKNEALFMREKKTVHKFSKFRYCHRYSPEQSGQNNRRSFTISFVFAKQ